MLVFFLLAAAFSMDVSLGFFNYFIFFVIGTCITAANLIFKVEKLQIWVKVPLHFAILLGLTIIFVYVANAEAMKRDSAIFVVIITFIILYALIFAAAIGIKKLVYLADKKLSAGDKNAKKSTSDYKPRYK